MKPVRVLGIALSMSLFGLGTPGFAQEKKISRADLPPAVERTVAEQSKGATIRGFSKEAEGGKTVYEAQLTTNGHSRDISIDESGKVLEIEEEVALDTLPTPVKDGLRSAAGAGQIVKVESLTKLGKLIAYEAVVATGDKRTEIKLDPAGKKLGQQ